MLFDADRFDLVFGVATLAATSRIPTRSSEL
jgi:hypothetical protein